jgi:hypothetical protein
MLKDCPILYKLLQEIKEHLPTYETSFTLTPKPNVSNENKLIVFIQMHILVTDSIPAI